MSEIDLDELERMHKAATPGPWTTGSFPPSHAESVVGPRFGGLDFHREVVAFLCLEDSDLLPPGGDQANGELIAAARNALPALIARVRELGARTEDLELARLVEAKRIAALEGALRGAVETHDHEGCPGADCYVLRDARAALEGK